MMIYQMHSRTGVTILLLVILVASAAGDYLLTNKNNSNAVAQTMAPTSASSSIPKVKVEVVASHLSIPWSIAFAPDGRIFFTERIGNIRIIDRNGTLLSEPAAKISVVGSGEGGLLGIALDPEFENNHFVYVYYTYTASGFPFGSSHNRVSRFTEKEDNKLSDEDVLLDNIPAADNHDGGRIKFGPVDGKFYVTTGDATNRDSAQDTSSLAGKILRLNKDGTVPEDNPFKGSPVYSYGHRNTQGLAWDPVTSKLVETEHGPSGELGFAHDEINIIEPGKNYGWPKVMGYANSSSYVDPVFQTGDKTWAPSGATFYTDNKIPEWNGKLLVATLSGSQLEVIQFDANLTKVISIDSAFQRTYGRLRDIEQAPDGSLYLLTSNQDGRGTPAPDDDKILRIVGNSPEAVPEYSSAYVVLILAVLMMLFVLFYYLKERNVIDVRTLF
jgi:glucose/arabinose dehydrogenase